MRAVGDADRRRRLFISLAIMKTGASANPATAPSTKKAAPKKKLVEHLPQSDSEAMQGTAPPWTRRCFPTSPPERLATRVVWCGVVLLDLVAAALMAVAAGPVRIADRNRGCTEVTQFRAEASGLVRPANP